ncbi:5-methyltetrahydropteroyltriglutamate--homocysteine S-methyltransferase, partial [Escherichia coli]
TKALNASEGEYDDQLAQYSAPIRQRQHSTRVHNAKVAARLEAIKAQDSERNSPYTQRAKVQRARFNLPLWPTTTIGSFPQTTEIRTVRLDFK